MKVGIVTTRDTTPTQQENAYASQIQRFSRVRLDRLPRDGFALRASELILNPIVQFAEGNKLQLAGYPRHGNLGDQAIWHAHRMLFRSSNIHVAHMVASDPDIDRLASEDTANTTVIFTGGGSLGDRYGSSAWRLKVMSSTRNVKYLQLPISTTFSETRTHFTEELEKCYSDEGRMLIMCRDSTSRDEARERLGIESVLVPDMVCTLPDLSQFRLGGHGLLPLLRKDQEVNLASLPHRPERYHDWDDVPNSAARRRRIANHVIGASSRRLPFNFALGRDTTALHAADWLAKVNTVRGLAWLSLFDVIVTDRLHGMLMSDRLGIPCHVVDNDHGKISRFLKTWGAEIKSATFHDSIESAIDGARSTP